MFNLLGGLATLAASIVVGLLWDLAGPMGTFFAGAMFTAIALAGLFVIRGRLKGQHPVRTAAGSLFWRIALE